MKPTCEAEAKELFEVEGLNTSQSKWNPETRKWDRIHTPETRILSADDVACFEKYDNCGFQVKSKKSLGKLWPKNAVVVVLGSGSPYRCCSEESYEITSSEEMTDDDFEILRSQGCFMGGQQCGLVTSRQQLPDGSWKYKAGSFCDSSD